jgi:nucleoside-diphosphate-sugar epimerase
MRTRVALVGANGFIGNRMVEMLHLGGRFDVRPVVRRVEALALARRFDLEGAIADACDRVSLEQALHGCEVVVHAAAGDPATILESAEATYRAACAAGARRMVYLSSASVHGQSPAYGTTDETPLSDRQGIPYNNAKVQAEALLRRLRPEGSTEIVMLRPGIVHGPRSSWIGGFADELLAGRGVLVNGGEGICNGIYVDNLVDAAVLAMDGRGRDGEAYGVGDAETYRWVDLLMPVAEALEIAPLHVQVGSATGPERGFRSAARGRIRAMAKALLPPRARAGLRAGHSAFRAYPSPPPPRRPRPEPLVTEERRLLHECAWKLPHDRATRELGYQPRLSFTEAIRHSIDWLAFADYPVRRSGEAGQSD